MDSSDRERIAESREELFGILQSDEMARVPVVVVANKQDLPSEYKYLLPRKKFNLHIHVSNLCSRNNYILFSLTINSFQIIFFAIAKKIFSSP